MKKKSLLLLAGLLVIFSFGCGKKEDTTSDTAEDSAVAEDVDKEISGYLIDNADQYVTLGNYKGLDIEKPVYQVSDSEVEMEIDNERYSYITFQKVDRASQSGDCLTVDLKATMEGEDTPVLDEQDYAIDLGSQEFGEDFDAQLENCKVGDTKTFSCSFDEDSWYEEWIGKTLNFEVTIKMVEEMILPDYDDDFVKNTLGFDSKEDYEASVREILLANYEDQSNAEAKENAILAALSVCEFSGYPDKLYDTCKSAVTSGYAAFASEYGMDLDELYEAFDMTDEDIESEAMDEVNRRLFISALCQKEQLSVTTGEYAVYLNDQYAYYNYEDADSFEADLGKETVMWMLYEDKVSTFLMNNGSIYEADAGQDGDDLGIEDTYYGDDSEASETELETMLALEETDA
ncbi:MAG: FKBP-type peptidyl-prolyl cis-trans isomerase [Lachnospiraceae bacterium]|nr:FKBP-type peptidyl-prolyl cis-trans isomerase [Lachnospiraceae bacterium]